jgi:propanol-preferring alcohol dehydrogenase
VKAAVVHDFTAALRIEDLPIPEPGPGEVLVKIETSGLCHTDIHAAHGDWPVKPSLPLIPGHEGVGIVAALGQGVTPPGSSSISADGRRVSLSFERSNVSPR